MILHRFMSDLEFSRLMAGETLKNHTNHRKTGHDSDAVGFCFFAEDPDAAVHWLRGACCTDVLVTFDVPDSYMRKAIAFYRDANFPAEEHHKHPKVPRIDYCTTSYHRNAIHILASTTRYRLEGIERMFIMMYCSSYHYQE